MSPFGRWLAHAVLTSVVKRVDEQLPRLRNVWLDQTDPAICQALEAAWNRLDEARRAAQTAIQLIKEASS